MGVPSCTLVPEERSRHGVGAATRGAARAGAYREAQDAGESASGLLEVQHHVVRTHAAAGVVHRLGADVDAGDAACGKAASRGRRARRSTALVLRGHDHTTPGRGQARDDEGGVAQAVAPALGSLRWSRWCRGGGVARGAGAGAGPLGEGVAAGAWATAGGVAGGRPVTAGGAVPSKPGGTRGSPAGAVHVAPWGAVEATRPGQASASVTTATACSPVRTFSPSRPSASMK